MALKKIIVQLADEVINFLEVMLIHENGSSDFILPVTHWIPDMKFV